MKCSNCGALLSTPLAGAPLRCTYCGATTLVQAAPPPAAASMPAHAIMGPGVYPPNARPARAAGAGCALSAVISVVALVAAGGVGAFLLVKGSHGAGGSDRFTWEGVHAAILTDLNGDGVPDIVGRLRYEGGKDAVTLGAFDGATGKKLWESDTVGSYTDTNQGKLGMAEGSLLFATEAGQLIAYGLHDGKRAWASSLPERADGFCRTDAGQVAIRLVNKGFAVVRLSDGQPGTGAKPTIAPRKITVHGVNMKDPLGQPGVDADGCGRLTDDTATGDQSSAMSDVGGEIEVDGMRPSVMLQRVGGPKIVLGTRKEGTPVPMIAGLFADASRDWTSDLASTNVLQTCPSSPTVGAVTNDRAFTSYGWTAGGDKPRNLVAFDLSGHRLWDIPLPDGSPLTSIQATDTKVLVSQWGRLMVYDAATGRALYALGSRVGH